MSAAQKEKIVFSDEVYPEALHTLLSENGASVWDCTGLLVSWFISKFLYSKSLRMTVYITVKDIQCNGHFC